MSPPRRDGRIPWVDPMRHRLVSVTQRRKTPPRRRRVVHPELHVGVKGAPYGEVPKGCKVDGTPSYVLRFHPGHVFATGTSCYAWAYSYESGACPCSFSEPSSSSGLCSNPGSCSCNSHCSFSSTDAIPRHSTSYEDNHALQMRSGSLLGPSCT